jgi:vancomycin resistance protein YoaR
MRAAAKLFAAFLLTITLGIAALYGAGYTIRVDLTDPPPAGASATARPTRDAGPPSAPTPTATPRLVATVVAVTATPRPATLDTAGPPFRLLLDGNPTALDWATAQSMIANDAAGRLIASRAAVQAWVAAFVQDQHQAPQRAAFRWNAATRQPDVVVQSHSGRTVDTAATVARLAEALESGQGQDVAAVTAEIAPEWTDDRLPVIGDQIIGEGQIYYADDDAATIQNVEQGALALDGAIALPGAVFSHDAWVYDGRDYAASYAIVGDRTLLAPGGGLCIVATTLFQTAFWGGLPIVERHNHPYWISMYAVAHDGQTYKGLDATVGDVRFRNTTGAPLRIHAWTADGTLHIQLIGTRPTWTVRVRDYAITDYQPALPTVSYFDEPSLPKGRQEVARNPHDGFTATLTREVIQNGTLLDTYTATSHYQVTEKQILVGTGE